MQRPHHVSKVRRGLPPISGAAPAEAEELGKHSQASSARWGAPGACKGCRGTLTMLRLPMSRAGVRLVGQERQPGLQQTGACCGCFGRCARRAPRALATPIAVTCMAAMFVSAAACPLGRPLLLPPPATGTSSAPRTAQLCQRRIQAVQEVQQQAGHAAPQQLPQPPLSPAFSRRQHLHLLAAAACTAGLALPSCPPASASGLLQLPAVDGELHNTYFLVRAGLVSGDGPAAVPFWPTCPPPPAHLPPLPTPATPRSRRRRRPVTC